MTGLDKRVATYQEALEGLTDNVTLLMGDFGLCRVPENPITEVRCREVQGLIAMPNNCGVDDFGLGMLLGMHQVRKMVVSYVGGNVLSEKQVLSSELETILTPQGALAERLRADGVRIPVLFTVTGYGILVAGSKEVHEFAERPYILEQTITGGSALVKGWKADRYGNVIYRHTAQNFNSLTATAGRIVIVEVEGIVPPRELDPVTTHIPGIFVNRIIRGQFEECTEQHTLRQKGA